MKTPERYFKTIEITPEEFYTNVPKTIVPKKALKGDFVFFFVADLNLFILYNRTRERHFLFM